MRMFILTILLLTSCAYIKNVNKLNVERDKWREDYLYIKSKLEKTEKKLNECENRLKIYENSYYEMREKYEECCGD